MRRINLQEYLKNIGKTGNFHVYGLNVSVRILDFKISYGIPRYQITPLEGSNEIWVNSDSITIQSDEV